MVAIDHLCRLRGLVADCLGQGLHGSAAFHAEKLCALSRGSISDTYLLAQCYFASKQFRRALALLRREEVPAGELQFKCLIAKCLAESSEWEECLSVLGDGEEEDCLNQAHCQRDDDSQCLGSSISMAAQVWHLRGRAFEALENRTRAVSCYKQALLGDPYCFESFSALISGHMLTNEEEVAVVEKLKVAAGDEWLPMLYRCRCKKYMQQGVVEDLLSALEAPRPGNLTRSGTADAGRCCARDDAMAGPPHRAGDDSKRSIVMSLRYTPQPTSLQQQQQQQQQQLSGVGSVVGADAAWTPERHDAAPSRGTPQPPSTAFAGFVLGSPMATTPSPLQTGAAPWPAPNGVASAAHAAVVSTGPVSGGRASGGSGGAGRKHTGLAETRPVATSGGGDDIEMESSPTALVVGGSGLAGWQAPDADSDACIDGLPQPDQHGARPAQSAQPATAPRTVSALSPPPQRPRAARAGFGLASSSDVAVARAELLFGRGAWDACFAVTAQLLAADPYALSAMPLHLGAALQLGKKSELFLRGHKLVDEYPKLMCAGQIAWRSVDPEQDGLLRLPAQAISWYAVGLYYMCTRQYEAARRHFSRALDLEPHHALAWLGFGHAFAALDERDQAMTAYRTAARLFPGLHTPVLGMGMEYCAMNNLQLAEHMLLAAHRMCPCDPAASHELGVLNYKNGMYAAAGMWLQNSLQLLPGGGGALAAEPTLLVLGHCLRKQKQYEQALACYERALLLNPGAAGTHAAVGLTRQLMGQPGEAVEALHCALALRPDDALSSELLAAALHDHALIA